MLSALANGTLFGQHWNPSDSADDFDVLALHGWGGSSQQMHQSCCAFNTIAPDLPGFGASAEPGGVWGALQYADAVAPIVENAARPITIVGYSFGGRIAVHLAQRFPFKCKALVLTGVPLLRRASKTKPSLGLRLAKRGAAIGLVSKDRIEQIKRNSGSADYRQATGVMRDVLVKVVNETYEEQLRALTVPTHFVWGQDDTAAPVWIAHEAQRLMPPSTKTQLHTVENADHWFVANKPDQLSDVIRSTLEPRKS